MSWWSVATTKLGLSSVSVAGGVAAGVVVGVVAGLLVTGGGNAPAATAAQAWIDQPLDGSSFADGPIRITVHATDPEGVAAVVVTVDGVEIHEQSDPGAPTLMTASTTWAPPGPGRYAVGAFGRDPGGGTGAAAVATIQIGGDPEGADADDRGATSTSPSTSTVARGDGPGTTDTSSSVSTIPIVVGTIVTGSTIPSGGTSVPTGTSSTTVPRGGSTTSVPPTTTPRTTVPVTTTVRTTVPPTTAPPTTAPPTTAPPTTARPTTVPPTTAPPTTAPPTTLPPTTVAPCVPGVPILVSPPDGGPVFTATPTLAWEYRGCGPASFTVQVADNSSFLQGRGSYVRSVTVAGSARSTTWEPLACPLDYYWRVLATDSGGSSAWSPARSFFADC